MKMKSVGVQCQVKFTCRTKPVKFGGILNFNASNQSVKKLLFKGGFWPSADVKPIEIVINS
jgi:hypothetical protein